MHIRTDAGMLGEQQHFSGLTYCAPILQSRQEGLPRRLSIIRAYLVWPTHAHAAAIGTFSSGMFSFPKRDVGLEQVLRLRHSSIANYKGEANLSHPPK